MQRHIVIIPSLDGGLQSFPMKQWLRDNPAVLPDADPTVLTSHQLRRLLRQKGWHMESNAEEIRLIEPSASPAQIENHLAAFDAETEILAESEEADDGLSFELEHQLRDFILANLGSIEVNGRKLEVFQDKDGRKGREYPTPVGFIDILAQDTGGNLYAFELKRARTSDHAVGQVLRYMGWLGHHLADGREVHGIIVAKTLSQSLRYAVSATPNVAAFEYSVEFTLHHATPLAP